MRLSLFQPDNQAEKILANEVTEHVMLVLPDENDTKGMLLRANELLQKEISWYEARSVNKVFSKKHYLEVMNKDVNKGEALKKLFLMEGINIDKVIAFGDAWNDLEMLQIVGHGVAMGNAEEELKTLVGRSCGTNDEDGIGEYLEKQLKINS